MGGVWVRHLKNLSEEEHELLDTLHDDEELPDLTRAAVPRSAGSAGGALTRKHGLRRLGRLPLRFTRCFVLSFGHQWSHIKGCIHASLLICS